MQTTNDILSAMLNNGDGLTSKMLATLIREHRATEGSKRLKLWKRYTLEDVKIQHHTVASFVKINEKLAHDFYADVVDTKTGYMGNEVTTSLDREEYKTNSVLNESAYKSDRKHLADFQLESSSEDMNSEMVGLAGATGLGYRLLYIPKGLNEVKAMNLYPWEVIFVYDDSLDEAVGAIRYYIINSTEYTNDGSALKEITVVEWYDRQTVTYYIDNGDLNFRLDNSKGEQAIDEDGNDILTGGQPHMFDGVPIIPFPNNGLTTAEPEKVLSLIDAYDLIMSATTSEIEQFRLAYMYAKGSGLMVDDKFVKDLEQTGIFPLSEDGEIGFVNKELAIEGVKVILDEIRKNIYQFSKSIDMSKDFGGDMRVIGWQVTLLNLENSSKITERKFKKALREQYRMLTGYWGTYKGVNIDPLAINYTFTRNFPKDIHSEAETLNLLLTAVSKETAYSQMSFIDDPEAEITKMEEEIDPFREVEENIVKVDKVDNAN
jgi:SPP1 family phage portal protein